MTETTNKPSAPSGAEVIDMIEGREPPEGSWTATLDGYLVSEEGEIVGQTQAVPDEPRSLAEWFMKRRAQALARQIGLEAERDVLMNGIAERYGVQVNEQTRRIDFLDRVYRPAAEQLARDLLRGQKAKNVKFSFGTIQFRKRRDRAEVTDPEKLVEQLLLIGVLAPLKLTIDLNAFNVAPKEGDVRRVLDAVRALLELGEHNFGMTKVDIRPSYVPDAVTTGIERTIGEEMAEVSIEH